MTLLEEANLARIEHQAAAGTPRRSRPHVCVDRATRLEREVYGSSHVPVGETPAPPKVADEKPVVYALGANRRDGAAKG